MKTNRISSTKRSANGPHQDDPNLNEKQQLAALIAFKNGDFSARLPQDWTGLPGKIADTFNDLIRTNQRLSLELARIGRVVGKEGRITQRAFLGHMPNAWSEAIGSVNSLIDDLVQPTTEMT